MAWGRGERRRDRKSNQARSVLVERVQRGRFRKTSPPPLAALRRAGPSSRRTLEGRADGGIIPPSVVLARSPGGVAR